MTPTFPGAVGVPAYDCTQLSPRRHTVALLIPVLNESGRIEPQLEAIRALAPPVDIVIADGGSTDGTSDPARLLSLGVQALLVKRGPGKLSAQLRMGFHHALGRGDTGVITMDGNGKDGPEAITRFAESLQRGAHFVQGSRFIPGGLAENTPISRLVGIRLLHAPITSLAARHRYTDSTNGFRAFSRELLTDARIALFRDVFVRYELLAYLPIRAARLGFRAEEIPVARRYPETGKTPTKIHGIRANLDLLKVVVAAARGAFDPTPEEQAAAARWTFD